MAKLYKRKKDTGVIPEMGISEETRDRLAKRDWTKSAYNPKADANSWTTKDCEIKRFSGIRVNSFSGMTEIWAAGRVMKEIRTASIETEPNLLATALEEAFATNGTLVEIDVKRGRMMKKQQLRR